MILFYLNKLFVKVIKKTLLTYHFPKLKPLENIKRSTLRSKVSLGVYNKTDYIILYIYIYIYIYIIKHES